MKHEWKCVHYWKQLQNRAENTAYTDNKEQRKTEGKFKMSHLHHDVNAEMQMKFTSRCGLGSAKALAKTPLGPGACTLKTAILITAQHITCATLYPTGTAGSHVAI